MSAKEGNPLVSVIIPAYNLGLYLQDCLESVSNQTFREWECIVVDDGSEDNTANIVKGYIRKDARFKYVYQQNKGLAGARNSGLLQAQGRYIQFLDADDLIEKEKLNLQVQVLSQTSELALSYTDYYHIHENHLGKKDFFRMCPRLSLREPLKDLILKWENEKTIPAHCFLFDIRFFRERSIRFDESLKNHEDWDCWVQIFRLQPKVYFIDQKLAVYRMRKKSMAHSIRSMEHGFLEAIEKQFLFFDKNSIEYSLLVKKLDRVKRDYSLWRFFYWLNYYAYLRNLRRCLLDIAKEFLNR